MATLINAIASRRITASVIKERMSVGAAGTSVAMRSVKNQPADCQSGAYPMFGAQSRFGAQSMRYEIPDSLLEEGHFSGALETLKGWNDESMNYFWGQKMEVCWAVKLLTDPRLPQERVGFLMSGADRDIYKAKCILMDIGAEKTRALIGYMGPATAIAVLNEMPGPVIADIISGMDEEVGLQFLSGFHRGLELTRMIEHLSSMAPESRLFQEWSGYRSGN